MCPALVDKEKLVRDQAQKSVDIYIARIRKFAATMPDTVLPSPGLAVSGGPSPRMGTPATENSWAGWAISSFTNKLASTSGQMQANSSTNGSVEQRSSSVPPSTTTTAKPPVPLASKPGMLLHSAKSTANIPTITSPDPAAAFNDEADDFNNDWGGFADEEVENPQDEEKDPWGTPAVSKPASSTTSYDDKGEPDFAGWLAAQSNSKKVTTKSLPKGLTKSTTAVAKARPVTGRTSTTGSTRKVVVPLKKEVKKEVPKAAEEEEEGEGWGDAW
jgi:SCY1-like protein 1